MAGDTLNINSTLQCPHGGSVQIISANTRVKVGNAYAALSTDQFIISGCSFQIPIGTGTKPSPCMTVRWVVSDLKANVNSGATLTTSSVGICQTAEQIPQGKVLIVNTQATTQTQ